MAFEILYGILGLAILAVIIYTLVKQAKAKEWVWFILTLIFPIVWIIYWIVKWVK